MSKTLRFILGDQLSHDISSLCDADKKNDIIFMCEVMEEALYVKHHKKKIAFIFSAMRHFAAELEQKGFHVVYVKIDDTQNTGSFTQELERAVSSYKPDNIVTTFPGEMRVLMSMQSWEERLGLPVQILDDDRFLCTPEEFKQWSADRKQLRMEYFYREMRKKSGVLMTEDNKPEGGQWNYDSENRKPPKEGLDVPQTYKANVDDITAEVLNVVEQRFDDHFGDLYPFHFAVTRAQALDALDKFIEERFHHFGDYQDAMIEGEAWMFHSHISFYLNCGLLNPLEVVEKSELAYFQGEAPLNAVEGFIRQIIGWREYVRGVYWLNMPDYEGENFLQANRNLPDIYWGKATHMNCLAQCVKETKENAYAHHIQRLMVLGNFALLAGLNPDQVNEWYMIVYADAYQWVELPNVTGMILFADGGHLASKPYAAGGAYINKMSNYCKNCRYKVSKKNGPDACPFNYLYWNFFLKNEDKLKGNPRLNHPYATLSRMDDDKKTAILNDANHFLKKLDQSEIV